MKTRCSNSAIRTLAIEQIESRLLLSGDGFQSLDTHTFNLDALTPDYAIIADEAWVTSGTNAVADSDAIADDFADGPVLAPVAVPNAGAIVNRGALVNSALVKPDTGFHLVLATDPFTRLFDASSVLRFREQLAAGRLTAGSAYFADSWKTDRLFDLTYDSTIGNLHSTLEVPFSSGVSIELVHIYSKGDPFESSAPLPDTPSIQLPELVPIAEQIEGIRSRVEDATANVPVETLLPAGGSPILVIAPPAPADTTLPIGQSDAQINVGRLIDELQSRGNDFVDHTLSDEMQPTGDNDLQVTGTGNGLQAGNVVDAPSAPEGSQVAGVSELVDEGGMIPIQGIVGQLAAEEVAEPYSEEVAATSAPTEISAELARVAVMELIEGAADPAAPHAADHTYLVVGDNAAFEPESSALGSVRNSATAIATIRIVTDQAELAATLVAPASSIHLAALVSAFGDAFATATMSAPLVTSAEASAPEDARHLAFCEWDDSAQGAAREEESRDSIGMLSLVGVLAVERVIAAKRKQGQPPASVAAEGGSAAKRQNPAR